jgi:hypothetical protein
MRFLMLASAVVVVASGTLSTILWRDLRAERQIAEELRTQRDEARAELVVKTTALAAAQAAPPPAAAAPIPAPVAPPAKTATEAAKATLMADSAKRAKTLMADSEYRKVMLDQVRVSLRQHYVGLAQALGITQRDVEAVIDIMARAQMQMSEQSAELMANGMPTDEAARAEMMRLGGQVEEQMKTSLTAVLGPEGFDRLQEFDQTEGSRTRVINLTNLLARSGQPLSAEQSRQLTSVMVAEQRRMEAETKAFADAGQTNPKSQAERQAETNRNILAASGSFLTSPQLELMRGRFQQRANIDQAADRVQQRERELLQSGTQ